MKFPLLLVVVVVVAATACAGVVIDKSIGESFSSSSSNSLPVPPSRPQQTSLSSQYGPPLAAPPSAGGPSLQYGPPPPLPHLGFSYAPPPPPPPSAPSSGTPFSLKKNKFQLYSNALSLFEGECAPWKGLSMVLLLLGAATGLGVLIKSWPLNLNILGEAVGAKNITSRLSDPAFLSSVYEQVSDISRVLMNIKDANVYAMEE